MKKQDIQFEDRRASVSSEPAVVSSRVCGCRRRSRNGERGVALVMVLGVLAVVGVMAAHVAAVSEVTAREARVASLRQELKYAAESATARAYWMLLVDRAEFSSRKLGLDLSDRDDTQEPWMTDGKVHELQVAGFTVRVAVYDAEAGLDCSGRDAESKLRTALSVGEEDEERQEALDRFLDVFADYVDADDVEHLDGMEDGDYDAEGMPDLPRNGPMQFREEIYWLEGAVEVLGRRRDGESSGAVDSRTVRLIPPTGFSFGKSGKSSKPSFFASSPEMIRQIGNLTDSELDEALRARDLWQKDGTPVEDSMDPAVFSRLQSMFSFEESGVSTIMASALSPDGAIRRTVRVTRDARSKGHPFADPQKKYWSCWERIVF